MAAMSEIVRGQHSVGWVHKLSNSVRDDIRITCIFVMTSCVLAAPSGFILAQGNAITEIALTADGNTLFTAVEGVDSLNPGKIEVWDVVKGQRLATLKQPTKIWELAISPDGQLVSARGKMAGIPIVRFPSGELVRKLEDDSVWCVAFSPDGKMVAAGGNNVTVDIHGPLDAIKVWDIATGTVVRTLTGGAVEVEAIAFSPNGRILAAQARNGVVGIWEVSTGEKLGTLHSDHQATNLAISPDGSILAAASAYGSVRLWDLSTGSAVHRFEANSRYIHAAFSPDGKTLASGQWQTIQLWDVATGKEVRSITNASHNLVSDVVFTPDGKTLISADWDGIISTWELASGKRLRTFTSVASMVR